MLFVVIPPIRKTLVLQLQGADLLYHEATFLDQHQALAAKTKHSTAKQAATIARKMRG
jgi:ribonuclease Z